MNAEDRFAEVTNLVEAMVAKCEAELFFALRAEAAVALIAGCECGARVLLLDEDFWIDF